MQGKLVDFDNRDDEVKYSKIKIGLASPEMIEDWSFGEVLKPETINYRSLRPEKDGLFCEKIFGTTRDWECFCGKYKSMRYRGMTCDRCGVEITHSQIRRERMGHIKLATPVAHIWFYKAVPSRIGLVLNLTIVDLKSIIYYEKYIVLNPGGVPDLKKHQLLTEVEYFDLYDEYGDKFEAGIGAEVIRDILMSLDLEKESLNLREKMAKSKTFDKRSMLRLGLLEDFLHSSNQPEWMLLFSIPVLPPELRPMVQLDGGRFATSDLNDLYRRLINRNNRLKKLIAFKAPDIIVKNEKRMLQEAVDALFDNSRRKRSVKGSGNRPLKSLSDILKGKQGRFRQNLLGKRVDYSARSVIVVGPDLKLHQCGIPKKMALELFRPFIMNKLMEKKLVFNVRGAKRLIDKDFPEVWNILEKVVAGHPVLLNRAPTLHRLGMQAFEPVLIEGKAIRLHPLVCAAYNADFDGDQMAVHLPLSAEAQIEAWTLMLSSFNILDPANGAPVVNPSQDIVLGIYNLTNVKAGARGEAKIFSSQVEMSKAFDLGYLSLQALIKCEIDGELIETTYGRLIFSEIFPEGYLKKLVKEVVADVNLGDIIAGVYKECGNYETVLMLDRIKEVGFKYSTVFANTISLEDIVIPEEKSNIILDAQEKSRKNSLDYQSGIITEDERYQKNISLWTYTIDQVAEKMMNTLEQDQLGHNSLYVMAKSGARGSTQQIRQLAGMRGLMAKPSGDIIDMPIISNFKEGLDVLEYFISTHGARKGLSDTALKTADAGYLTRKLVDIAQDVTITEDDCGTISGINVYPIKSGDEFIEKLSERVVGRYSAENIINPFTEEILLTADQLIEEKVSLEIDKLEIEKIKIRTVVTCDSSHGICQKCYGVSLTTNRMVEIGEAVGIVASQSIGQPGTQLTMRTFHVGGAASSEVRDPFFKSPFEAYFRSVPDNLVKNPAGELITARRGFITLDTVYEKWKISDFKKLKVKSGSFVKVNEVIGEDKKGEPIVIKKSGQVFIDEKNKRVIHTSSFSQFPLEIGSTFVKQAGEYIEKDEIIYTFDNINEPLIAEISGTVRFQDIVLGKNLRDEIDDYTGVTTKKIVASKEEKLQPKLVLVGKGDETIELEIPIGSNLLVEDGRKIKAGEILSVRIRPMQKTTDITGGLPRVQELFEARNPSSPAIIAEIDGEVEIGEAKKSKRIVYVVSKYGKKVPHIVEIGKALLVRTGDFVKCGELLCDGMVNPHDILRVSGDVELYRFVLRNVQEVYKRQGVNINDKHIGVIVRQMLRKVEVVVSGDASYIRNELVDKYRVRKENQEILKEGGKPAIVRSVLLGLTKASLNTESFISSASFQETSKVLSNAAIRNAEDNLVGLKENVIIGQKIPAGTGSISYSDMTVYKEIPGDLDYLMGDID